MTDVIQGSDEWHEARLGKVTASRISDVMAQGKGGKPSATRANYLAELVAERLTGNPTDHHVSAAMQWGTDTEPHARAAYQWHQQTKVIDVGFVDHPTIAMSGASPDGLVGEDGGLEIKCPNTSTHIGTILGAKIDRKYLFQMHWGMACTGRQWWDFVSFDPRMGDDMQYWRQRVERDGEMISAIETEVARFLGDVDETVDKLKVKFNVSEPVADYALIG